MKRILFVCTGNICRSPTAEGIARRMAKSLGLEREILFDSAGTQSYHSGQAPDPRAVAAARMRGYELSSLRARALQASDYEKFDLILAMDAGHLRSMRKECPAEHAHKLKLFMSLDALAAASDVPDPYYGGPEGFEQVLDMCERSLQAMFDQWR